MVKLRAASALAGALWLILAIPAHGDVGGNVPGPGLCDYPGVGASGLDGIGVYHYWCDFPVEENGSRWHCEYGGAAAIGSVGVNIFMFNASLATPVGILQGSCSWRCPDMSLSAPPNPPGAWRDHITPAACRTVAPNPDIQP